MQLNNSLGSIEGLLTINTTVASPQNDATNVLIIQGTGGIVLPKGTNAQQPTHVSGLLRYNTDNSNIEISTGTAWKTLARFEDIAATVTSSYVRTTLGLDSVYLQSANLNSSIDSYVTATYVGNLVDSRYVNVTGDSMTGYLTLHADPSTSLQAATKNYVDTLVSSGATWRNPVDHVNITTIVTAMPGSPIATASYIKYGGTQNETWDTVTNVVDLDVLTWSGTAWSRSGHVVAGYRVILAGELPLGTTVITGFYQYDLIQYVSGDPNTVGNWTQPEGQSGLNPSPTPEISQGVTVLCDNALSTHYGHTYMYNSTDDHWTEIAGPGATQAGTGLHYVGTALTLDIPVLTSHGGTGLTSIGTANQVLGVNNGETGLEYKSVVGTASQIGVTHTANTITLTNLGVLSVASSVTNAAGLTLTSTTTNGAVAQEIAGTLNVAHGGTGLTTSPTNGQLLIGNGTGYTLAGLTAGTGISVTPGAGSISIANTGVTSVDVSGGTTGLTTTNGPITTTGTITLGGTLNAANGGTGLSALGTANQVLGVNNGATAAEYKTITAGTAISVTHGAGSITLNNTGVTSAVAGTGISVSSGTGAVTINNTGVTSVSLSTVTPNGGGTNVSGVLINGVEGTTTLATGTVTTTGTITIALNNELQSLANLSSSGMVSAGSGTYVSRSMVSGASNTITITNGDGVAGDPTFDLTAIGTPVSASFVKITTNAYGQISATTPVVTSDITSLVDNSYVNVTGDTMSGTLTFTSGTVTGLTTPVLGSDAATKSYVDAQVQGLNPKQQVRVATLTSGTLASSFANGSSVDGITLATGDRILIKNQTNAYENGIYTVNATGAPTRALDQDSWAEVPNAYVFVSTGSQADTGWVCTSDAGGTLGVTNITWVQFSGVGTYKAGSGLTLTDTTFSITAPVSTALGGTGLTTMGSQSQFLAMNSAGTALQYTSVSGTGIYVDFATDGLYQLVNTGVTATSGGTTGLTLNLTGGANVGKTATLAGTLVIANGGTGLSTAPAANQVLIGTAGGAYELSTLTAGTGIGIVNSAGVLTISNSGILAVTGDNGTATGLTLSANTVTGTTTLTLGGTLNVANGGTGLTALGTAYQVLGVNAGATANTYLSIVAGTGITVTNSGSQISIASAGGSVTSVGLAAPSIFTVSNSPVISSGTLTFTLNTQNANLVFAGPSSGAAAEPTFRSLVYTDLPIQLYDENPSTPTANTVSGANAVAIGSGASATGAGAVAIGTGALASQAGGVVIANGGTSGSAQTGTYVLRNTTTDGNTAKLYLDGTTAQIVLANNSLMSYNVTIAAFNATDQGAYKIEGGIFRGANAASTTIIGTGKSVLAETTGAQPWDANVVADTTNGALSIEVTGATATTIKWVATVTTTEVLA